MNKTKKIFKTGYKRRYKEPRKMSEWTYGRFTFDRKTPNYEILNQFLDVVESIEGPMHHDWFDKDEDLRRYFQRDVLPRLDDFRVQLEKYFTQDPIQTKLDTIKRLKHELEEMKLG